DGMGGFVVNERVFVSNELGRDVRVLLRVGVEAPVDFQELDIAELGQVPFFTIDSAVPASFLFTIAAGGFLDLRSTGSYDLTVQNFTKRFTVSEVPVPAAGILFGSALLGAGFFRRRKIQEKLGLPV
ncbi:MAG: PEP-CTERM sorting domain-containing protein, partial [Pseudomonadota bacterium]